MLTEYLEEQVLPDGETVIRIRGHRITIEHILERYLGGESAEQLAAHFETLTREEIDAVIAYYHAHQGALDHYLVCGWAAELAAMRAYDAQAPSPGQRAVFARRARRDAQAA